MLTPNPSRIASNFGDFLTYDRCKLDNPTAPWIEFTDWKITYFVSIPLSHNGAKTKIQAFNSNSEQL